VRYNRFLFAVIKWSGSLKAYSEREATASANILDNCITTIVAAKRLKSLAPFNYFSVYTTLVILFNRADIIHSSLGRLRSSNCNSNTIAFARTSCRAISYFTLSVEMFFLCAKSIESNNLGSFVRIRDSKHQNFTIYCFFLHFLYTQCVITKVAKIIALFIKLVLRFLLMSKLLKSNCF